MIAYKLLVINPKLSLCINSSGRLQVKGVLPGDPRNPQNYITVLNFQFVSNGPSISRISHRVEGLSEISFV